VLQEERLGEQANQRQEFVGKCLGQQGVFKQVTERGVGSRDRRKRRNGSFQGPPVGIMFFVRGCFHCLRSQMRDFHGLLREKPSSPLMLLG
jgi:hypothetical protein